MREENPGLSEAMTEKIMKRSDAFLIPQGSLMSTANTESSQEPWWESPVQTAFSTKNVRTLISLNILQMRVVWWSKKIQKKRRFIVIKTIEKGRAL